MVESAQVSLYQAKSKENYLVFSYFKPLSLAIILALTSFSFVSAQESKPAEQPKKEEKKSQNSNANMTAEQVAESTIVIYGFPGGRTTLNNIRKTTIERGKIISVSADGQKDQSNYQRWILRGDTLDKEKIRFDQELPNAKYALIYDGAKLFGVYNESVFAPREDAAKTFNHLVWHGLDALLRYKENESKLELAGREKVAGVDYYKLDVIDKQNRRTRFYVSLKSFRVMMLEYVDEGTNYRRKFYDYNYAQQTLVPFRTVLWANDKQIEETETLTITFGQKIGDDMFQGG
ncbi:MAG: hypothetical protein JWN60_308 [Acidobacteria bacterium]|jgi:hypothetical protein|nr:hypothetical protein [Acidobacteriota bacterium]